MTSETRQQGEQVAKDGKQAVKDVGDTLSTEAQKLKDTAAKEARSLSEEARGVGHDHADQQFERGKHVVEGQVDTIQHALGDAADRLDKEGHPLASYAKELSSQLEGLSSKIENSTMDEVARDGRRLAKENPGLFMLGAVAVGFAASRFLKASDRQDRDYASDEMSRKFASDGPDYGNRGRDPFDAGRGSRAPGGGYEPTNPASGYVDRDSDREAYRSPVAEREYERAGAPTPVPVPRDSLATDVGTTSRSTDLPSAGNLPGAAVADTNESVNDLDTGIAGSVTNRPNTNPKGAN